MLALLLGLLSPLAAVAQQPLRVDRTAERMRVDGSLREWRGARFSQVGPARFALATNDRGLFVAVEMPDTRIVRRAAPGPRQDAVVLTLAMPGGTGKLRGTELWLHPGETGKSAAVAGVAGFRGKPRRNKSIKVVEGPLSDGRGYVLEAFVPWKAVRGAEIWQQGRGALRVVDAQGGKRATVHETAPARSLQDLPAFAMGQGQQDMLGSFLQGQGLTGARPSHDFQRNVSGDRRKERVVVVNNFVVVMGPGYRDGRAYGFMQLPVGLGAGVRNARLQDVTGDRYPELLVTLRQQNRLGKRDLWSVVSLNGDNPALLWGAETRKQTRDGFVESSLRLGKRKRGAAPLIILRPGRAQGLDASNFRDGKAPGVAPILVPWGTVEERSYRFDGSSFAMVDERVRPAPEAPEAPRATSARAAPAAASAPAAAVARRAPSASDLRALFEREQGLSGRSPRWTKRTNLAGDRRKETVHVYGNTLVMLGPGIGDGQRYVTYALPVASEDDIVGMRCADLTGDGAEELLFRVRQALSGGGDAVFREVLLVHHFRSDGAFGRILGVEVAREQGGKRIANEVKLPHGRRGEYKGLLIKPGKARGWKKGSYPWRSEATGGVGRLLLPWADTAVRYRFDGSQLLPR